MQHRRAAARVCIGTVLDLPVPSLAIDAWSATADGG
jgi:hypothetical protein